MIQVKNLYYTYPGNKDETIKGINFRIKKGEIFGLLGPNGAGKSTTQKIIIGILKKYRGSVKVSEIDIKDITSSFYEEIGVAFETPNLFNKYTAEENLLFFASLYNKETEDINSLLNMVGLIKDKKTRVSEYSKGMKMRLNFCRAFINNPSIVFLDEPTSGLDPVNARKIKDIIQKKKEEGVTVFLSTHDMYVADELCDKVGFIEEGDIDLIESPSKLKLDYGLKKVKIEYEKNKKVEFIEFDLNSLKNNEKFINLINQYKIVTMHTEEATLEEVFIKVTGRNLY
ncbi:MAG: ABC transporter ATP-binding protein [Halanaerobiales bacterium]|nr:ABC transporter ATP-binding protein [Halanaerobiales bacterium]